MILINCLLRGLRGDRVVQTEVTLKVVRTGVKLVLIYNCESGQNRSKACSYI